MNCSRPTRRCSMKFSSNSPSSPRNGNCLFRAFPGRGGTTIWRCQKSPTMTVKHLPTVSSWCQYKNAISFSKLRFEDETYRLSGRWLCFSTCWSDINHFNHILTFHLTVCLNNNGSEPALSQSPTLLSLSSSFFNHSKSLYLLLTQESFSLKMGRFVYVDQKRKEKRHNITNL